MATALTDRDREFLARPRLGLLTVATAGRSEWPAPRPVWFEYTAAETIEMFSTAGARKVRRLRTTPRASLVVVNDVGEPEHWISFVGSADVRPDGAKPLAARLAGRYWNLLDRAYADALEGMLAGTLVRIVLVPETVTRYGG